YGLAISSWNDSQLKKLERIQGSCLRMLVGAYKSASTSVLRHISHLPPMAIRVEALTAKYCLRYNSLPPDSLLHLL
ncbi:hypothetical protein BJ085DRAFT_3453, partial [Dimargaris cristalligena]